MRCSTAVGGANLSVYVACCVDRCAKQGVERNEENGGQPPLYFCESSASYHNYILSVTYGGRWDLLVCFSACVVRRRVRQVALSVRCRNGGLWTVSLLQ